MKGQSIMLNKCKCDFKMEQLELQRKQREKQYND